MEIEIANGSALPVDPKFNPVCGFDAAGNPVKLKLYQGGTLPVVLSRGRMETVAGTTVTASGSTAGGERVVTFVASSDFDGSVAGVAFGADESVTFRAGPGNGLAAIDYTRTAGSLRILSQTEEEA